MKNLSSKARVIFECVAQGSLYAIVITGLVLISFAIFNDPPKDLEKFKVVDKYKNCSVIRYTDPSNRCHYLLDCSL